MNSTAGVLSLLVVSVLIAGIVAALVAASTGLLARLEGESVPGALRRACAAFGATLTVLVGLGAFAVSVLCRL